MSDSSLYPMTFEPVLKHYIWGGRSLERLFGRKLPPKVTAESWEIAAHKDGITPVENGPLAGQLLTDIHAQFGRDLVGERAAWAEERGQFPLLVKLLDAKRNLSVQVHPDDEFARLHEGNELGKTEMWVVLHAEPDASIVLGVKSGTSAEDFRLALKKGDLEPYLHYLSVKSGDVVCVPSGTLHAILGGTVIAEIQQNSNTTYRVFDWNRLEDGKPRPLHIEKALQVIDFDTPEPGLCQPRLLSACTGVKRYRLCSNQYFISERLEMDRSATIEGHSDGSSMEIWGIIEGRVSIDDLSLSAVRFALIPAAYGSYSVKSDTQCTLLKVILGQENPA